MTLQNKAQYFLISSPYKQSYGASFVPSVIMQEVI